jgi:hypothetical protein
MMNRLIIDILLSFAEATVINQRDRTLPVSAKSSLPVAAGLRTEVATPHVDAYGGSFRALH